MHSDTPLHRLAAKQGGAFALHQATRLGLSKDQLKRRVRTGEFISVHESVYVVAGAPRTDLQALWAALLGAGPSAAASRRSAAQLWNLRGIWRGSAPEITVPRDWADQLKGVVVHRSDNLAKRDVVVRTDGLQLTSPARTLLDIGRAVGPMAMESACIDALHRGLVTHRKLVDVYARVGGKGRPGSASMRKFLLGSPEGVAAIESELEVRFWRLVRELGLRTPTPQFWVVVEGERFRLDFAWPDLKAGIELNGKADHEGPLGQKRDRRRTRLLSAAGWSIHELGWGDVVYRSAELESRLLAISGANGAPSATQPPKLTQEIGAGGRVA